MDVLTVTAGTGSSWVDVALALLNVIQTVALAYLAADRHAIRQARAQGLGTRADDSPSTAIRR